MESKLRRTKFPKSDITKNIKLIRTIAWKFHVSTSLDYADLLSEGCLAYLNAVNKWNPQKAAITTFMWTCISSHLKNYIKKQSKHTNTEELTDYNRGFESSYFFENLSPDAIILMEILSTCKSKFLSLGKERSILRLKSIATNRSWSETRFNEAIINLQNSI